MIVLKVTWVTLLTKIYIDEIMILTDFLYAYQ